MDLFSTSTLASIIQSLNETAYSVFSTLLTNLLPFVVIVGVVISVWYLVRRALRSFR